MIGAARWGSAAGALGAVVLYLSLALPYLDRPGVQYDEAL